jgi:catechol 2,3-dioxygenase-like lactoylglutathione lyase family enzyme
MKRFHLHIAVEDLEKNIRFYSALFGSEPTVRKPDYAKWMLDDPRVNFAISMRGVKAGVDHLGIQVENDSELDTMRIQMVAADASTVEHEDATCCYATSNKYWVQDPQGLAWEAYHTLSTIPVFGQSKISSIKVSVAESDACCAPSAK